jgi:hypothetical protein
MGAEDKLDCNSRWEKKGACQWNHSGQPPGWLPAPAEHRRLRDALQFLIANARLKLKLSPKRISKLKISNREQMTIFQSENWADFEFHRIALANSLASGRSSSRFLIGTFDISEFESTSGKHATKPISNRYKNDLLVFPLRRDAARLAGSSNA